MEFALQGDSKNHQENTGCGVLGLDRRSKLDINSSYVVFLTWSGSFKWVVEV
jgi:hypothetical protein